MEVLHCGNGNFRPFCSCDLDLNPMTFICELNPYSLEIYRMCQKKNFLHQGFRKLSSDRHDRNYIPGGQKCKLSINRWYRLLRQANQPFVIVIFIWGHCIGSQHTYNTVRQIKTVKYKSRNTDRKNAAHQNGLITCTFCHRIWIIFVLRMTTIFRHLQCESKK